MDAVKESVEDLEDAAMQDADIVREELVFQDGGAVQEEALGGSWALDLPEDLPEPSVAHRLWTELAVLRERLRVVYNAPAPEYGATLLCDWREGLGASIYDSSLVATIARLAPRQRSGRL